VPAGTRFALSLSDEELNRWEERLPKALPEETRQAARLIAVALRDYGWFITDTSPGALFQFECRMSAGKSWDKLGLGALTVRDKVYPRDLLEGLFSPERVVAYVPSNEYPEELRARKMTQ
jgi:hypothetical protein